MSPAFLQLTASVLENVILARNTYRIRLHAPELARRIVPGQFMMLRPTEGSDPLLGRPFALCDTVLDDQGEPSDVDIVYLVVGKMTGLLSRMRPGESLEVWGPLGNGFPHFNAAQEVGLVAGGIGQTPFLAVIRQILGTRGYGGQSAQPQAKRVVLYYGVRSADLAAGVEDFRAAGAFVHLATEDGSAGQRGYVTDLVRQRHASPNPLLGCGPEPMLHALAQLANEIKVPCHLSLETPMACGVGICFSCVTPVKTATGWDYRRVCVDGPIFDAQALAWTGQAE